MNQGQSSNTVVELSGLWACILRWFFHLYLHGSRIQEAVTQTAVVDDLLVFWLSDETGVWKRNCNYLFVPFEPWRQRRNDGCSTSEVEVLTVHRAWILTVESRSQVNIDFACMCSYEVYALTAASLKDGYDISHCNSVCAVHRVCTSQQFVRQFLACILMC